MKCDAIHKHMSLREIAMERPTSIPLLERLGLDFYCRGEVVLIDAAESNGLEVQHVLKRLEAYAEPTELDEQQDWRHATMAELADHIEQTHHAYARAALARLEELAPRVIDAQAEAHPELIELQELILTFAAELHDHMVREERVLFPWLRRLERKTEIQSGPPWSVRRPISCMIHDHDDVAEAFRSMRRLTPDFIPPRDACGSLQELYSLLRQLEQDTHVHLHKENNILFPAGVKAEAARKLAAMN